MHQPQSLPMPTRTKTFSVLFTLTLSSIAAAQTSSVDPTSRSILFVRGAFATGGATEGGTPAQRTEQLSDITNTATNGGNHGYGELRSALVADGFKVSQLIESKTAWTLQTLLPHRVVVMGSNNKTYTAAEIKAFHDYIDAGGSALFVSDANWGPTWEGAPASDNQFLGRYGALVYQDGGGLPTMSRATTGRYLLPAHPVLAGPDGIGAANTPAEKDDVTFYNGEGVSCFRITKGSNGYQAVRLVSADGINIRLNTSDGKPGKVVKPTKTDAAMILVEKGQSRIVGHFDRNTWFNKNGAGTNLGNLNNKQLALNIFRFLASVPASAKRLGTGCANGSTKPLLAGPSPVLGKSHALTISGAATKRNGLLLISLGAPTTTNLPNNCTLYLNGSSVLFSRTIATTPQGNSTLQVTLPNDHRLSGQRVTAQAAIFVPGEAFLNIGQATNALELVLGFPR